MSFRIISPSKRTPIIRTPIIPNITEQFRISYETISVYPNITKCTRTIISLFCQDQRIRRNRIDSQRISSHRNASIRIAPSNHTPVGIRVSFHIRRILRILRHRELNPRVRHLGHLLRGHTTSGTATTFALVVIATGGKAEARRQAQRQGKPFHTLGLHIHESVLCCFHNASL